MRGTAKPIDISFSPIYPINIGLNAPPATPITIYDEAFLVCTPIPSSPRANIVGNMMDMKKKEIYSAYKDIFPNSNMTRIMHKIFASE